MCHESILGADRVGFDETHREDMAGNHLDCVGTDKIPVHIVRQLAASHMQMPFQRRELQDDQQIVGDKRQGHVSEIAGKLEVCSPCIDEYDLVFACNMLVIVNAALAIYPLALRPMMRLLLA